MKQGVMSPEPLFSIVIPAYNREVLLARTLKSVLAQEDLDLEVIVVDDGSTDRTREVAGGFGPQVRVMGHDKKGPGAARNAGIRAARGKYICLLDSDDLWFPWTTRVYRKVIEQANYPSFVSGKHVNFKDESELASARETEAKWNSFPDYFSSTDKWRWYSGSCFVVRRDVMNQVGGLSDEWVNTEDAELTLRLGTSPGFVELVSPATFAYRIHGGNTLSILNLRIKGMGIMLDTYKSGKYPEGKARRVECERALSFYIRPVAVECLKSGRIRDGWRMYKDLFGAHLRLRKYKFLMAFLIVLVLEWIKSLVKTNRSSPMQPIVQQVKT